MRISMRLVLATTGIVLGLGWFGARLDAEPASSAVEPLVLDSSRNDGANPQQPQAAAPIVGLPAESRQMLVVTSADFDASAGVARRYQRPTANAEWVAIDEPVPVSLGRNGLAWGRGLFDASGRSGPVKKEGDGRSPAGVFDLREATGYAADRPAGAHLPYRQATATLRCVDDSASRLYNRLADESEDAKDWSSAEDMRRADDLYRLVVWVGHNDSPPRPGGGSCIFLHLRDRSDATTAGCTAFDAEPVQALFTWLDPAQRPVLVQLPRAERDALREVLGLPRQ